MTNECTLTKRPAGERGQADHGWLQARFTFSFAEYHDPEHMGFKSLRVMNNDTIQPGGGFPTHPHRNMEIFTYIIEGQLEHRDSMGNGAIIEAGNLQYMSAGSGIEHSEFNPSSTELAKLYQIWLEPTQGGGEPRYAEKPLGDLARENQLILLFSGDGRDGSTAIRQDAEIYFCRVGKGQSIILPASSAMAHSWLQLIDGSVDLLGEKLSKADGLAIENHPESMELQANEDSTFLFFRLS